MFKKFNFTLREILFLIVALCALLALYVSNRTSPLTGIPKELDAETLVNRVVADQKLPAAVHGAGASSSRSRGKLTATSGAIVRVKSKDVTFDLMDGLEQEVRSMLSSKNCSIHGSGESSNVDGRLESFSYEYSCGKTEGEVLVRLIPADESILFDNDTSKQNWEIWIHAFEYSR